MTSVDLARSCLKVAEPLLAMIVDDDEKHMGQLRHESATVGDALSAATKLLTRVNSACAQLKKDLLKCDEKKIDRKCEEGILIHMVLQAILLLRDETLRLKALDAAAPLTEKYFPSDPKNAQLVLIQKLIQRRAQLIKRRNGDADAVSMSSITFDDQSDVSESASKVESVSASALPAASSVAATEAASESAAPVVSVAATEAASESVAASVAPATSVASSAPATSVSEAASKDEPASETSVGKTAASETSSVVEVPSVAEASSAVEASSVGAVEAPSVGVVGAKEKKDAEKSESAVSSLMEEASLVLEESEPDVVPLPETNPAPPPVVDYSGMSVEELQKEAKKQRTNAQKDAFIAQLLLLLAKKDEGKEKEEEEVEEDKGKEEEEEDTAKEPVVETKTYVVEDVSKFKRKKNGVEEVLVKWKGFPLEEMTWEVRTDELTRSNVAGTFFQAGDTSYKKFCERAGLGEAEEKPKPCKAIGAKDKKRCEKRKAEKVTTGEKPDDSSCTSSEEEEEEEGEKEEEDEEKEEKKEEKKEEYAEIPTPAMSDDEDVAKIPTPAMSDDEGSEKEAGDDENEEASSQEASSQEASSKEQKDASEEKATVESVDEE